MLGVYHPKYAKREYPPSRYGKDHIINEAVLAKVGEE